MKEIETGKEFLDENGETVKNWEDAQTVIFSAWVAPELKEKAYRKLLTRARAWQKRHQDTYIQEEAAIEAYNGEFICSVSVNRSF